MLPADAISARISDVKSQSKKRDNKSEQGSTMRSQAQSSHIQEPRNHNSSLIPSPLLRLPAELRIAIYDYVFGDIFYHLNVHRGPVKTYSSFNACNLGLIAASRQLHSETRLLPYKLGIFTFHVAIPDRSEDYQEQKVAISNNMQVYTNGVKYNPWTVLYGIAVWTQDDWEVATSEQLEVQWLDQELW
ncbi:hypothetical protein CC77DRAFT_1060618 [Alternaria alternata]|uniref:Uncharacterized protein n=1 Tax=Alternaria alternata TaxID=5599 RepID=A0A177DRT6_ALTAL|nr:hypothetical protein CC77DRAFT_1060618 [Alternaria alternata]OAG21841.1 hypothetical protein CC77DRAFT_1060618 [Alternaria alternata]